MDGKEPGVDMDLLIYFGETMRSLDSEAWEWLTTRGSSHIDYYGNNVSYECGASHVFAHEYEI